MDRNIIYQHKYDPRMTVSQSHSWAPFGVLLNENRLVILVINLEDIKNSKSWEIIEENQQTYD
jgi:hypothetical protein